ncbi:MAG: alpha/beta fold hydrolase, partial [Chitinophagaceae bacterium]|nr:alpha/beta fold hydrolase [Anaerolineae bacterium]
MQLNRAVILSLILLCLAPKFSSAQDESVPRFEESSCDYSTPAGVDVTCGYVVVLEDHNNSEGETIRLALAILHSTSDTPLPDPIVSLTGGPGGSTLEYLPFTFRQNYRAFLETRDFIMFDQRGVGLSEPSLDCPNLLERNYEDAARLRSSQEAAQDDTDAILDCQQTLIESGADLTIYTTAQNAADVADIRVALGYDDWNLFGVSYGTKLALTTMRDYP